MYNFILQISMVVALGIVLLILARAVPRMTESQGGGVAAPGKFERLIEKIPLHKIDQWLRDVWIKVLKKAKIAVMKIDHHLGQKLSSIKTSTDSGTSLKEKMELLTAGKENKTELLPSPLDEKKDEPKV